MTEAAVAARNYFESLGGVWLKLGQLLSLRTDLFRQEFCDQLSKLHERAWAFPFEDARPLIEEAARAPIEDVYSEFNTAPVAAASFAQVYRARLACDGTWVAVKVQKPWADEYFRLDMLWITALFRTLDALKIGTNFQWNDMLVELTEMIADELDYRFELNSLRKLRPVLWKHDVYAPRPFREYSNSRVLVMEFLHGTSIAEFIRVQREDPERAAEWLRENQISPKKVAQTLLNTTFRQIFEDSVSHGDLHPGNVMLFRRSRVALLDFGNVAAFDPDFMSLYSQYLIALTSGRFGRAADLMLMISGPLPEVCLAEVRSRMVNAMRRWGRLSQLPDARIHEKSLSASSNEIGKIAVEYKFRTNWSMLKLGRAFGTLDMSMGAIYPDLNFPRMIRSYYKSASSRATLNRIGNLLKMPLSAPDLVSFIEPAVRDSLIAFRGAKNEAGLVLESMVKGASLVALFALVFVGLAFLDQLSVLPGKIESVASPLLGQFPRLSTSEWVIVLIGIAWLCRACYRLAKRLRDMPGPLVSGRGR